MLHKAEGLVIRSLDYGEGHKIIGIYTKEYGKLSLMARGAKRPRSRHSSIAQLFIHGRFLFFRGVPGSMGTLSQGEIIHSFPSLRQDLVKTAYAAYFSELVDQLFDEEDPPSSLFSLLLSVFHQLEEEKDAEILSRLFELKVLVLAGFKPEVERCVVCRAGQWPFLFSVREGGILCDRCKEADSEALALKPSAIKLLRYLYHFDPSRLGATHVSQETKEELRRALWLFMDVHTPLRLKSRSFLEEMDRFWSD